ncbi:hypothetical protein OAF98_03930 [Planctomicrobium sp.]|jgi:hypothetical protein|nr:hypothetical protein [Planctomicrobium sp.]MDB4743612.1 hypothetical protein [Planctomicrobium sp.]
MAAKKKTSVSKKMLAAEQSDKNQPAHPVLVLIAGFMAAVLLFFCCACGGAAWWFQPEINENPDRAREIVAEMIDIQIPDSYQPKGTIEMNVAYTMSLRGAYYERFVGDGLLTLIEVNSRFQADEDVREHIRETLMEKGGGGTPLIVDPSDAKTVQVDINGQLVPFEIEIGRDPPSGRTFYIVEGVFKGKNGEVLLAMRVNEDNWEETSIIDMLQSIGEPLPN